MKRSKILAGAIALVFIVSSYGLAVGQGEATKATEPPAAATEHAGHAGHDMSQMSGMEDMKPQDEAMAAHLKTMQTLMEKINTTENPAERKQLMAEHLAAMASGVKMMREMDNTMMMGMMKSGKCPMMETMASPQGHAGMQGMMGNMPMCHTMMQKKADRNFTMMEQLIESQKQLLKLTP